MNTKSTVTPLRRPDTPDIVPRIIHAYAGGRRWGYPLKFKMDAIRMVREQGMPVSKAASVLDIGQGTLKRWLDYYDLKRIPPKGSNEYPTQSHPVSPAAKDGGTLSATAQPASTAQAKTPEPPDERREQIREAISFLKQAVDYLFIATRPTKTK